jgi:hypothetical protein
MGNHSGGTQTGAYAARAKARASTAGAGSVGGGTSTATKAPKASVHATAAHLQAAQHLPAEVAPAFGKDAYRQHLTTVGTTDQRLLDPYGAPNPRALAALYGEHQLGAALSRYTPEQVRAAATSVHVSTTGSKDALVSRITAAVTGGRYSANFAAAKSAATSQAKAASDAARTARAQAQAARATAKATAQANRAAKQSASGPKASTTTTRTPAQREASIRRAQAKLDAARAAADPWHKAMIAGMDPNASEAVRNLGNEAIYRLQPLDHAVYVAQKQLAKAQG